MPIIVKWEVMSKAPSIPPREKRPVGKDLPAATIIQKFSAKQLASAGAPDYDLANR
jgi:hypothetical protein